MFKKGPHRFLKGFVVYVIGLHDINSVFRFLDKTYITLSPRPKTKVLFQLNIKTQLNIKVRPFCCWSRGVQAVGWCNEIIIFKFYFLKWFCITASCPFFFIFHGFSLIMSNTYFPGRLLSYCIATFWSHDCPKTIYSYRWYTIISSFQGVAVRNKCTGKNPWTVILHYKHR